MSYKVIENDIKTIINIKKSEFITTLFYVSSKEEADIKIKQFSEKDATHNCYAYIVLEDKNIYSKFSDDNEPQGTAGIVMLEILKKNNLVNILALTTRYFGGIKLGASGLTTTYRKGVVEALEKVNLKELKNSIQIEFNVSFSEYSILLKILENKRIININFSDNVFIRYSILEEDFNNFILKIENLIKRKLEYKEIKKEMIKT